MKIFHKRRLRSWKLVNREPRCIDRVQPVPAILRRQNVANRIRSGPWLSSSM